MTLAAHLAHRSILALSGPDLRTFLQGLMTNDIRKLSAKQPLYAALLTPQGKILFDFLLYERDEGVLMECAGAVSDALKKRLLVYRLRAKVEIAPRDDLAIVAQWNGDATGSDGWADPRLPALGRKSIVSRDALPTGLTGADAYLAHRLELGVPEGDDFGQDRMFALDADLDELHGVAFDKGCYVGQELTARMKHRGTARKRLVPVTANGEWDVPAPGTSIRAAEHEVGTIASCYGKRGFALVRMDRLHESPDVSLDAAGVDIRIERPHWLFA
jgi:folate-binding protein YgfZ